MAKSTADGLILEIEGLAVARLLQPLTKAGSKAYDATRKWRGSEVALASNINKNVKSLSPSQLKLLDDYLLGKKASPITYADKARQSNADVSNALNNIGKNTANKALEDKARQQLLDEINGFPSKTKAGKTATMVGAYDPITGKTAVGSSNGKITANDLHPKTVAYIESQLNVKIGEFTSLCSNKAGACAEVSAADKLVRQGVNPSKIQFTDALRPKDAWKQSSTKNAIIQPCNNCKATWPKGTK